MRLTAILAISAPLILGTNAGHGQYNAVPGDCCAVWDSVRNVCIEGMQHPGFGRVCHSFDNPPLAGSPDAVPQGCYVWRMKTHKCLERGPGPHDGFDDPQGAWAAETEAVKGKGAAPKEKPATTVTQTSVQQVSTFVTIFATVTTTATPTATFETTSTTSDSTATPTTMSDTTATPTTTFNTTATTLSTVHANHLPAQPII